MAEPKLIVLDSVGALLVAAERWNDLWRRSAVTAPVAQAELVAQWVESWAPNATFRAYAVEQDGQLVAAIPLVGGRIRGFLPAGKLPANICSWAGDLLIDPRADAARVLAPLVAGLRRSPWSIIWFDTVPLETNRWKNFLKAAAGAGLPSASHESFRIGEVQIDHDWETYQAQWSRSHRRQIRRGEIRADEAGGLELVALRDAPVDQIEMLLQRGFGVENRSWKGRAGTSLLGDPKALGYYVRQATLLAERGQLQLTFLENRGQPIAFEYGWQSRGTYFSPKVGYDEVFAALSPGQLLRARLLKEFFADSSQLRFDFAGPLTDATEKWTNSSYAIGRIAIAAKRPLGKMFLHAYKNWWPSLRRLKVGRRAAVV